MFAEDLSIFFNDFAVSATFNAETGKVIFNKPENLTADNVVDCNYQIIYPATQFTTLAYNSTINVNGTNFRVNYITNIQDGALKRADLEIP